MESKTRCATKYALNVLFLQLCNITRSKQPGNGAMVFRLPSAGADKNTFAS